MSFETPNLGWHPGMSETLYHSLPMASASALKLLSKSPAHLAWDRRPEAVDKSTAAMKLGTALHVAVLEPERFESIFAVMPKCDRRTTAGKETYAAFVTENAGRTIIDADDCAKVLGMAKSLRSNEMFADLVENATAREISGIWQDKNTGVICKMRGDLFVDEYSAIVDVKSCVDASPTGFLRAIVSNGYHLQGEFYLQGAGVNGRHYQNFLFACVESQEPYFTAIYQLSNEFLGLARAQIGALLELYRECEESGMWPGYSTEFVTLEPPKWLKEKHSVLQSYSTEVANGEF